MGSRKARVDCRSVPREICTLIYAAARLLSSQSKLSLSGLGFLVLWRVASCLLQRFGFLVSLSFPCESAAMPILSLSPPHAPTRFQRRVLWHKTGRPARRRCLRNAVATQTPGPAPPPLSRRSLRGTAPLLSRSSQSRSTVIQSVPELLYVHLQQYETMPEISHADDLLSGMHEHSPP